MTPERKQRLANSDAWKHWKYWSTGKKIGTVIFVLIIAAWYVFWNHTLPRLAEEEQKAGRAAATSASTPNLRIPKPDVPIPPNPNVRP